MLSIQQMQYILAVAEERQFQRASEKCFVTQPTLSMQVKKAEEFLGKTIFDRSRSPLELTTYGEQLMPLIRDTLSEYDGIVRLGERLDGSFRENIRLAIIPTIAGYMLPDLFDAWKEELTDASLVIEEMKTEEILVALEEKKIDMGILAGPVHHPRWRTTVLYQEEIYAYLPQEKREMISSLDLEKHHPWLLSKGNCLRTQMVHFCELNRDDSSGWNYEGGNVELLAKMVDSHGGYTLIPEHYQPILNLNGLKRIQSNELKEFPAREVIAISNNRTSKWPILERLIRTVQLRYHSSNEENLRLLDWK